LLPAASAMTLTVNRMIPNITPAPANRELPGIPGSLLPGRSVDGWFGLPKLMIIAEP
jgi:hypothetical protein